MSLHYDDRSHKYLSDTRDDYIAQSRMTVNGRVPTLDEVRAEFDRQFPAGLPSPQPAPAGPPTAGNYNPDPPTPEEVAEAFEFKYGV